VSQQRIGGVLSAQGDLAGAQRAYRQSLEIRQRLAESNPSNPGWQRDLAVGHGRIGDVLGAQVNLTGAPACYDGERDVLEGVQRRGFVEHSESRQIKAGIVKEIRGGIAHHCHKADVHDPGQSGFGRSGERFLRPWQADPVAAESAPSGGVSSSLLIPPASLE
jgi:hypothetical protein